MPLKIKINNLTKARKIDKTLIRRTASRVLRSFNKNNAAVGIIFVNDKKIRVLNRKYVKRNAATDVLSFLLGKAPLLGDVYISSDRALVNAKRFGTLFKEEILLYVIHGVLHLLDFGDKTAKEKKRMRKLEESFLKEARCSARA